MVFQECRSNSTCSGLLQPASIDQESVVWTPTTKTTSAAPTTTTVELLSPEECEGDADCEDAGCEDGSTEEGCTPVVPSSPPATPESEIPAFTG